MKYFWKISLIIFFTFSFYGCTSQNHEVSRLEIKEELLSDPISILDDEMSCVEQGGKWEQVGFHPHQCNKPTSDMGQACQNSSECDGMCLLDTSNGTDFTSDPPPLIQGICSTEEIVTGCIAHVENEVYVLSCIDCLHACTVIPFMTKQILGSHRQFGLMLSSPIPYKLYIVAVLTSSYKLVASFIEVEMML